MPEFESPTYVLDLRDGSNRSRIESAKPGKVIQVLVRPEHDTTAQSIVAKGTRSNDGASFSVVVKTEAGEQTHDWAYKDLLEAISAYAMLAVLLLLSGCGGSNWKYSKPGMSQQQMRQDGFECKQISRQPYIVGTGRMLVGGSEPTFEVWKECLEARGYTVTEVPSE